MKLTNKLITIFTILIAFGLSQAVAPRLQAQVLNNITADVPGGGNGSSNQGSDSSNEGIYIAAGIALAAVLGYALYKKYSKSDDEDTSTTNKSSLNQLMEREKDSFVHKMKEIKEKIPVDLYFGIKNQGITIPDRTYSFGIAYRF